MKTFLIIVAALVLAFAAIVLAMRKKTFTYQEAMRYFAAHKSDNPRYVKGLLTKEALPAGGFLITQAFLDKDGNAVGGSKIKVAALEPELLNAFKDKDMIIIT